MFTGPPTSEMEPLDDEAKKLTAKFMETWEHPIESLPATGTSLAPTRRP